MYFLLSCLEIVEYLGISFFFFFFFIDVIVLFRKVLKKKKNCFDDYRAVNLLRAPLKPGLGTYDLAAQLITRNSYTISMYASVESTDLGVLRK